MTKKECLEEIKKACNELVGISDIKKYYDENHKELVSILLTIISYMNYVSNTFPDDLELYTEAFTIVYDMIDINPQLKPIVDSVLGLDKDEKNEKHVDNSFNPVVFANNVRNKIQEFRGQNGFDTDNIGDYQSIFEYSLEKLNDNKDSFSNEEYDDLNNRLLNELQRIHKFNELYENKLSKLNVANKK